MKISKDSSSGSRFRRFVQSAVLVLFFLTAITILLPAFTYSAEMEDYCLVPPYVKRDVSPNIMMLMDVSTDMSGPAYPGVYSPNATKDNYDGYFNPQGCYRYSSKFEEAYKSTSPDVRYTYADTCPSSAPFRGNLMNWATMSKFDILQKVIIGGNATSKQGNAHTLVSISDGTWAERVYSGCRFKMVNGAFTIEDAVLNGDCTLVLPAPIPIASLKKSQDYVSVALQNAGAATQENPGTIKAFASGLSRVATKLIAFASTIWEHIHFVSEAEAANCVVNSTTGFSSSATVGAPYSFVMTVGGGDNSASFTWTFNPAAPCSWLPAPVRSGNKNQTATASGTPNTTSSCTFTVTAARTGCTAPPAVSKTITPTCPVTAIAAGSPGPATVGQAYTYTVIGSGGYMPVGHNPWSASGLPPGLSINTATGVISGTPTACGTYNNVVITYASAAPCGASAASRTYSIAVTSGLQITQPAGTRITDGQTNNPYSYQLQGSGGTGTYSWATIPNCLHASPPPYNCFPHGLTLNPATGLISGTPTFGQGLGNDFTFRVTLSDQSTGGCSMPFKDVLMRMNAAATPLNITSACPPNATKGEAYSFTATAAGGTLPYTWSGVSLPAWLSINAATGVISGTAPNITSTGNVVNIRVTDNVAATATKNCTIDVVRSATLNSQSFGNAVKVDLIEEPFTDLNGNDIYDPGTAETYTELIQNGRWDGKQGVFQKYWDANNPKARWGLTQYSNSGVDIPSSGCIPASPASAFYTSIQNVQMRNSPLADGLYAGINYYGQGHFTGAVSGTYAGCSGSDPLDNNRCRKNFVLIVTAGGSVSGANFTNTTCTTVPNGNSAAALVQNACFGAKTDLRDDKEGKQNIFTYVVNTMGTANNGILEDAALAGNGNYYYAASASELSAKLELAFKDMLSRAASGTAASVLASGEGSGANLIQAVFYPRRKFQNTEISWIGRLTNLWYYVDPRFGTSSIFEDNQSTRKLNLTDDYKITLSYNPALERTEAARSVDPEGDGTFTTSGVTTPVEFEKLNGLWEAGLILWKRDISSSKRKIYTTINGTQFLAGNFSQDSTNSDADNAATLQSYFNLTAGDDFTNDSAVNTADARTLIRYIHGEDFPASPVMRSRTVKVDLNGDDDFADTVDGFNETVPRVWKLGDILNATPKISSWAPLNLYHKNYNDKTYQSFIDSNTYKSRGMVFAGGNDGMLHAFKLGTLDVSGPLVTGSTKAALCNDSNGDRLCTQTEIGAATDVGKEEWAFIPKNVLPYLKYLTKNDYCHIYSVDLTPYIFDASIGSAADGEDPTCTASEYWNCSKVKADLTPLADPTKRWRTVLIGGMRYGGACREPGSSGTNNVKAPVAGLGYSSYFALDVTDQSAPTLLWEFSHPDLGFSTPGAAVVKISARRANAGNTASEPFPSNTKNDRWFVVLASGPTGPINGYDQQFMGRSDQELKVFILDLKGPGAGAWTENTNYWVKTSGKDFAFAGSILSSTVDTDYDGQDNVLYIPYVQRAGTSPDYTWTDGGVLRLITKEDSDSLTLSNTALNPANWALNTVIGSIGPVTSSVAHLQNSRKGQLWLYFGTGRYYFESGATADDATGQRQIFGLREPCYSTSGFDVSCTASQTLGNLTNVTDIASVPTNPDSATYYGWYINLDPWTDGGTFSAERVISNPFAVVAGVAFFSTYMPYQDPCAFGGNSRVWAVNYNTGGAPGGLQGMLLLQSSTGSIEQINLSERLTQEDGRATDNVEGKPPEGDPPPLLSSPPAIKRVIHTRER